MLGRERNMRRKRFFLPALLVLSALLGAGLATAGELYGTILDEKSGQELIGANVLIVGGNKGASTDLDGRYRITDVAPGLYEVRFTFMGYSSVTITDVRISSEKPVKLDIGLVSDAQAFEIEDIVVSADRVLSTNLAILAERRKAATIGDAISADQISRSPDATSGDALRRVTGLTVVDNKYVSVRGVTDRYNGTTLNGVSVTSTDTEVDKKSFSYDLIPSNLLSSTVVVKTATPDMPGDFSGGLVKVNTLEFPTERTIKVSASSSWHDATTGKDFYGSLAAGDRDWLGFGLDSRDKPAALEGNELAHALDNNWGFEQRTAPSNQSISLSMGDRWPLAGGKQELGFLGAFSYKNGYKTHRFHEGPTTLYPDGSHHYDGYEYTGDRYVYSVLWGGLVDLNYKFRGHHKLSLKNNFNRSAKEDVIFADGREDANQEPASYTYTGWNERWLYLGQLGGEHKFESLGSQELEWSFHYSTTTADQPDRKFAAYKGREDEPEAPWAEYENYRSWNHLDETSRGLKLDWTVPWRQSNFKWGLFSDLREREFWADAYSAEPHPGAWQIYEKRILPIDQIFAPENFGDENTQWVLLEYSARTGEYTGKQELLAYYGMIDTDFRLMGQDLRLVTGLRVEDSNQVVETLSGESGVIKTSSIDKTDVLPSMNLTWIVNESVNVRAAASQSVSRPEFREMSNVSFLDVVRFQNVRGNPDLERALVHNYDLRFEYFPDVGEVAAISFFYKSFEGAIEEQLFTDASRPVRTWFNSPAGTNKGYEIELRKSLSMLSDLPGLGVASGLLDRLSIMANYTNVVSEIEYELYYVADDSTYTFRRPMQGQSPWSANMGILFNHEKWGTSINLLYNKFGRRLDLVGRNHKQRTDWYYEEPRDLIDLSVSQRIIKGVKFKFSTQNLGNKDVIYTKGETGTPFHERVDGVSYSASLSYEF